MNETLKELSTALSKTVFSTHLQAQNKNEVLAEIADILVQNQAISPDQRDAVLQALLDREAKMSTGMQYGIAIPHAKSSAVDHLVSVIVTSQHEIDFDTIDGAPCNIFVATLSPHEDNNSHIRFLAEVSRQLGSRRKRENLLAATTQAEMIEALCGPRDE